MGSSVSLFNDTDDTIYVKITANTKVITPLVTAFVAINGVAATICTGGLLGGIAVAGTTLTFSALAGGATALASTLTDTITKAVIDDTEKRMKSGLVKEGWDMVLPGQKVTYGGLTLSLNLRMWITRFDRGEQTMILSTANSSVWSGGTADSDITYFANDPAYFPFETINSYNVEIDSSGQRGGAIEKKKKVRLFESWRGQRSLKTHSRKIV